MSGEIKSSVWQNLSLPQKAAIYFEKTNNTTRAQAAFWNDWKWALQVFEMLYVH